MASQGGEQPLDWIDILALAAAWRGGTGVTVADTQRAAQALRGDTPAGAAARHGGALLFVLPRSLRRGTRRSGRAFCHPADRPADRRSGVDPGLRPQGVLAHCGGLSLVALPGLRRAAQLWLCAAAPRQRHPRCARTPICAVDGGTVEALGWNRYGGWRIGIRSDDRKRYYYYAHLRKDAPYAEGLAVGQRVQAGDVIGFMGRTGYSAQENVNNIETVHLHFGLQLIFDESQKECDSEIWIDVYPIIELLASHCSSVARDPQTGRWERLYPYCDLDAEPLRSAAAR